MSFVFPIYTRLDKVPLPTTRNTFTKQERLCSRKQMELLFNDGSSASAYPLKLTYLESKSEMPYPAQAMFVVPKRNFKKAHDRNRLKRRMKEAYRLNKRSLYERILAANKRYIMAFIFTSRKEEEYSAVESAVCRLIEKAF